MTTTVAVLIAVVGGTLIAIQSALFGPFSERVSNVIVVALWVHVAGAVLAGGLVVVGRLDPSVAAVRDAPWLLLTGVAGVGIVAVIGTVVGSLGLGTTLALLTGAQLTLAVAIDASGLVGRTVAISVPRVLGVTLIVAGVLLVFGRGEA